MTEERTSDALLDALGLLFPAADPAWSKRADRGSDEREAGLVAVPSAGKVRLLVPVARRPAGEAISRYSASLGLRETVQRFVTATGLSVAGTGLLPDRIVWSGGSPSIVDHLSGILGEAVSVSVGIGSLRANRKPVLGVFDRRGVCIAYAKVGHDRVAAGHVEGEATALRRIASRRFHTIEVPELIHIGDWNGMPVLICSALRTPPQLLRRRRSGLPLAQMDELASAFEEDNRRLGELALVDRLNKVADLPGCELSEVLNASIGRILELHGDLRVSSTAWHGDFTPWNMANSGLLGSGPVARLWDWERFDEGVLPGMDSVHWVVNCRAREVGFSADGLRFWVNGPIRDGLFDIGGVPGQVLVRVYLATIAARYLEATRDSGGRVLLPTVEAVLGALTADLGIPFPTVGANEVRP